ncbi:MAG: 50S ribosomal protein L9 [Candidatus Peribacteraceae bacterium]|nr:50S ribosomal protein L9 [Candidatus Peribacteraceae bacterium]MBP9850259.1 50S ribosomal protein L9 [Candidatus Peribacteraceae bacterium]
MEVLLLTDIGGVGKKNDLIVVKSGFALNHLLPERKALVVTPNVRKRYAEQIKHRALEREREREIQMSLSNTLTGKVVHVTGKASKAGKLYAAISEDQISAALKEEYSITIPASSIGIADHIKKIGNHTVTVTVGTQSVPVTIEVKAEAE